MHQQNWAVMHNLKHFMLWSVQKFFSTAWTARNLINIVARVNLPGLILATYCVQYPHAMAFLSNKMSYSLLKTLKTHAV